MRLTFNKYLAITATVLCFSNISFASEVISCESKSSNGTATFDYGDADVSNNGTVYGSACHDTNRWQQLGWTGDGDLEGDTGLHSDSDNANAGWTGEQSQNAVDQGDNGVRWRIKDSGANWGRGELTQGDLVEFFFIVKRSNEGNHKFDQLKAWNDWNGNGIFEDSENIIDEKWYKNQDRNGNLNANSGNSNSDLPTDNNADVWRKYYSEITVPVNAVIGDTWMRARVICENSLVSANDYTLSSTGYYHQGEVEDYKLAINQAFQPAVTVPEPSTLFVFGSALIGLVLSRKKTK
jgi:hypothetical protein